MIRRKVFIENDKIKDGLEKKDVLQARMKELVAEGERVQKEGDEIMQKMAREDEKLRPIIEKEIKKIPFEQYEEVSKVFLGLEGDEKGKVIVDIVNTLEEFKVFYEERKKDNGRDTKSKITDTGDNA